MNKKYTTVLTFAIGLVLSSKAQNIFTIEDVIERTKQQSIFSKQAETQKETSYWQYRTFRTNYNPQLRLNGNLPTYTKAVSKVSQNDGTFRYLPVIKLIQILI